MVKESHNSKDNRGAGRKYYMRKKGRVIGLDKRQKLHGNQKQRYYGL